MATRNAQTHGDKHTETKEDIVITPSQQYEERCKDRFDEIVEKLNNIDISIRGNGSPAVVNALAYSGGLTGLNR